VGAGDGAGAGSGERRGIDSSSLGSSGGSGIGSGSKSSSMQDGPTRGQSCSSAFAGGGNGSTGQTGDQKGYSYHEHLAAVAGVGRTNATVMVSPAAGHDLHSSKVEFVEAVRSALRRTVWVKHTNRLADENMHLAYLGQTPVCVLAPGQSATFLLSPADAAEPLDSPTSAFRISYSPFIREAESARQQARARVKLQAKQASAHAMWAAADWERKQHQQLRALSSGTVSGSGGREGGSGSSGSSTRGGGGGGGSNQGTKRKFESTALATIDEGSEPPQSSPLRKRRRTQEPSPGKGS
jgi:hypothetical protein